VPDCRVMSTCRLLGAFRSERKFNRLHDAHMSKSEEKRFHRDLKCIGGVLVFQVLGWVNGIINGITYIEEDGGFRTGGLWHLFIGHHGGKRFVTRDDLRVGQKQRASVRRCALSCILGFGKA
jgi:hypothetical protein